MRFKSCLIALGAALALYAGSIGSARAAEGSLAGRWVHKEVGFRVDMEFRADGQCSATATGGGKTSAFAGTYHLGPGEVVITPKDAKPIRYALKIKGDRLILSGGDFGDARLNFSKRIETAPPAANPGGVIPVASAQPAPAAAARPLADDTGEKKGDKPEEVKLPGGTYDMAALEAIFKVVKVKVDSVNGKVIWVMEAKEDVPSVFPSATLYDEDDVRIGAAFMAVEPSTNIKKGDHVRFTLTLPASDILEKVRKVVISAK